MSGKKCGIYCIKNLVNEKMYIGQSIYIQKRWRTHKSALRGNKHHNSELQDDWNKYGEENFIFEILTECTKEALDILEVEYIHEYGTFWSGYNNDFGGEHTKGHASCYNDIEKTAISESRAEAQSHRSIAIIQIDFDGNVVNKWNSISAAAKSLNIRSQSLYDAVHQNGRKTLAGYIWVKECDYTPDIIISDYFNSHNVSRKVVQYDKLGNVINIYPNFNYLNRYTEYDGSCVRKCCIGEKLSYKNFIWRYDGDVFDKYPTQKISRARKIYKYTPDGKLVDIYLSTNDAAKKTGYNKNSIANALSGKSLSHMGYIWRYEGESFDKYNTNIKNVKQIEQYDLDDNFIKIFDSTSVAAKELGVSKDMIYKCLCGKCKTAHGFIWKYV